MRFLSGARIAFAAGLFALSAGQLQAATIAFVGDSMADGIWGAFFRYAAREACKSEELVLIREAHNGSGLARPDHLDWEEDIAALVEARHPDLVIASIGLNDRQQLITRARERIRLGSDEWQAAYIANVTGFYKAASAAGAQVLILGLPVLRDARANEHAVMLNGLYSEAAADPSLHTTYVAPWSLEGSPDYASYGPGPDGRTVQLRAPDGIHFTQTGYDLIAEHLRPAVAAALARLGVTVGACFG